MTLVTIDDFARQKYISLATFKKDGTRVATPVWLAREADHLYVITDPTSGKAKRLRNSSRAQVAACDMRGTVQGEYVDATAVLMDTAGSERVNSLITAKYGLMARLFGLRDTVSRLLGRSTSERVGIEITLS